MSLQLLGESIVQENKTTQVRNVKLMLLVALIYKGPPLSLKLVFQMIRETAALFLLSPAFCKAVPPRLPNSLETLSGGCLVP